MTCQYNFSAGPSLIPKEVLEEVHQELFDWQGTGMSVMEMSHRSKQYLPIIEEAEEDLRALLTIPKNYKTLFLQGGASMQFLMTAYNFLNKNAGYINTGSWSTKAIKEAKLFGNVTEIALSLIHI